MATFQSSLKSLRAAPQSSFQTALTQNVQGTFNASLTHPPPAKQQGLNTDSWAQQITDEEPKHLRLKYCRAGCKGHQALASCTNNYEQQQYHISLSPQKYKAIMSQKEQFVFMIFQCFHRKLCRLEESSLFEVKQPENMLRGLDICETGVWRNRLQMLNDSELMERRLVRGDKVFGQSLERHTLEHHNNRM